MTSKRIKRQELKRGEHFRAHYAPNTDREPPYFSLCHMQSRYCLDDCDKEEKQAFAEAIWKRSQLRWADLKQAHRHKLGYEKLPHSAIRPGIPPFIPPDASLIAFRFCELKPMVGYRDGRVFHIVWLDHDRNLYDHG
jgi:hypothetical protein